VKNSHRENHKNLTNGLVTETRSHTHKWTSSPQVAFFFTSQTMPET